MDGTHNEEQGSNFVSNGNPPNYSPLAPTEEKIKELREKVLSQDDDPPVVQIEVGVANMSRLPASNAACRGSTL
jgi:hypothetical protein